MPLRQTIVKDRIVCSQHNDEVEPSLREPVHRVVFNDHTSISHDGLQVVENLQKQAWALRPAPTTVAWLHTLSSASSSMI